MKTYFNLILLFSVAFACHSQDYVPDPTFAGTGFLTTNYNTYYDNSQGPVNVVFINNKYIFTQKTQLSCFNYDGSVDYTFGTLGYSRLTAPNVNFIIHNSKFIDGSIYIFGHVTNNGAIYYGFIAKMGVDGILDATFGTDGIVSLNYGEKYSVNDIIIKNSSLYAFGTRLPVNNPDYRSTLFVSKFNGDGVLDLTFNTIGYKTFPIYDGEKAANIFEYENELLLTGSLNHTFPQPNSRETAYIFLKIDEEGNAVQEFGTNGIKKIVMSTGCPTCAESVVKTFLVDNTLFMQINHSDMSFSYSALKKVMLDDLQINSICSMHLKGSFIVDNDNLFVLGCSSNCVETNIFKRTLDGSLDLTFDDDGQYNFDFLPNPSFDYASTAYFHEDGRILLAGYTVTGSSTGMFTLVRIKDATLANLSFSAQNNFSIYPNPAMDLLNISNVTNEFVDISISDIGGKEIFHTDGYISQINVENFKLGLYLMTIRSKDKKFVNKFLKH